MKSTTNPIGQTCQWLRDQVALTVLDLKRATIKKDKKKISFAQKRLEDLGRRILHTDLEMDKLQEGSLA